MSFRQGLSVCAPAIRSPLRAGFSPAKEKATRAEPISRRIPLKHSFLFDARVTVLP